MISSDATTRRSLTRACSRVRARPFADSRGQHPHLHASPGGAVCAWPTVVGGVGGAGCREEHTHVSESPPIPSPALVWPFRLPLSQVALTLSAESQHFLSILFILVFPLVFFFLLLHPSLSRVTLSWSQPLRASGSSAVKQRQKDTNLPTTSRA